MIAAVNTTRGIFKTQPPPLISSQTQWVETRNRLSTSRPTYCSRSSPNATSSISSASRPYVGDLYISHSAYLIVSQTCKQLQRTADEHQVWLHQAKCLEIPIPPGTTPSKADLKDWVISRTRVDVCWTKRRPGDLVLHSFETDAEFVDAHFIPGGEFVVLLYRNGDISLNRIERSEVTGELDLREIARYDEPHVQDYPHHWSGLLMETSHGCPVIVCARIFNEIK